MNTALGQGCRARNMLRNRLQTCHSGLLCSRVNLTFCRPGYPKVQFTFFFSVAFILKEGRSGAEKEELCLRGSSMLRLNILTEFNFLACFLGGSE